MNVKYGYPIGEIANSVKLIVPQELNKIHLTPTRSKFIVLGTKASIFEWMENYGDVACEFDQESGHISHISHRKSSHHHKTKNHFKISLMNPTNPIKTINFELYEDGHHQHHDSMVKKLFLSGNSRMKLEIKVNYDDKPSSGYMTKPDTSSVMNIKGKNGIYLYQVLVALKDKSRRPNSNPGKYYDLSSKQLARLATSDYE